MEEKKNFGDTVSTLFAGMDKFIAAKTVVGEPIHVGDTIIIPLADVSFGMGAGAFAAEENKESDGGGAGGKMSPCAVLIISNGTTKVVSIKNQDGITKVLDLVPDLVNKFSAWRADGAEEPEET
ncbi:MAG: GerW family sporulation protein [Blautia sp.]|nr:GerW family sporulation protein [Blautia sp.]